MTPKGSDRHHKLIRIVIDFFIVLKFISNMHRELQAVFLSKGVVAKETQRKKTSN